jgi:hypothetical protein
MAPVWLKAVPWSTILSNAPVILDGAKKLVALVKSRASDSTAAASSAVTEAPPDLASLSTRVQELAQRQQETAELLRSLAETNAQLTQAVEALRRRATGNFRLAVIALVCLAAMGLWLALR